MIAHDKPLGGSIYSLQTLINWNLSGSGKRFLSFFMAKG